jgi:hypothetical protein
MPSQRLEPDILTGSARLCANEKGLKWQSAFRMLLDMLASGASVKHGLHSFVFALNLSLWLEVRDKSAEVQTFHISYELALERLHLFHAQISGTGVGVSGSICDTVLADLPGGLGSKFTMDSMHDLGIAYDTASWWKAGSLDMHLTWTFFPGPLPVKPESHLLFALVGFAVSCASCSPWALLSHGEAVANINHAPMASPHWCRS